jgi:hypothetical protein
MDFDTSRPQGSRANPLEPARGKWVEQPIVGGAKRLDHFRDQMFDTICPKCLKLRSPFGSSGLERIGLEPGGREVAKSGPMGGCFELAE